MNQARPRLFLVDGTALVYRAYFALLRNPLTTPGGEPVGAVFGLANTLFRLLREEKPGYMAVAFDSAGPTFRHGIFPGYKANRPPMPDDLAAQLPAARRLVESLGLRIMERQGMEADDLIGSAAGLGSREGAEVVIVSADKDFMQLVGPDVRQWIPPQSGRGGEWIDPDGVRARWGVGPEQMVDLLALMGDSSDNVPGVRGIGPKTAAQLLQQFGSLDGVYENVEAVSQKAVRARLLENRDQAYMSRRLVEIRLDLDPEASLAEMEVGRWASQPGLPLLLEELGFRSLLAGLDPGGQTDWTADYRVLNSADELAAFLDEWRAAGGPLCLDTETTGLDPRRASAVGIALAWQPGRACYIPLGHTGGGNLPVEAVTALLAPVLSDSGTVLAGQNLKFDLHVLSAMGLEVRAQLRDTMLASYLIDPEGSHRLDDLSRRHLKHRMIPITDLIGSGRGQISMDQVPVEKAGEYAAEDADAALRLLPLLDGLLDPAHLRDLWTGLECPLVYVLLRMEQAGVGIDTGILGRLSGSIAIEAARLGAEIQRLAGEEFNINSPAQLGRVLFESLRLPRRKRTKSGFSTDQTVLEQLAGLHPVPALVLEYRSLVKLKGTYVDALPELVDPGTGRIHASFNQMVTATGRLSSSDPNLQNIPVRTPQGREIRKAFRADEGSLLVSADYSQIELRILAHLSEDEGLIEAFREGQDIHAATARKLFGAGPGGVDPEMRARAKTVNFGVMYGMGPQRLAREFGIPQAEAKEFIETYFARMPGIRRYIDGVQEAARRDGYVTTIFGRRRILRGISAGDGRERGQAERMAANTPIQGSAADLIKQAMLLVDEGLRRGRLKARLILQVHDELVVEAPEEEGDEVAGILRECMTGAATLRVPLTVDIGRGRTWADAH